MMYMEWQFGGNFLRVLEWAGRQKKRIEPCAGPGGPGYCNAFRDELDLDNLEKIIGVVYIDLMGFTAGRAKGAAQNWRQHGLEAW